MNREIKFRQWITTTNKMSYDVLTTNNIPDRVLMQYTGLKDKNGKEIYEGDILEIVKNEFIYIFWSDEIAGFNWHYPRDIDQDTIKRFEVVGNIYENPELLEEGGLEE